MKLKEIHRTATFAWSPTPSLPLLATGTVAGALDESFSNESQLEIWAPDFLDKHEYDLGGSGQSIAKASVTTSSRFNRLAWGIPDATRTRGIIVAGMENGELDIWDPSKIVQNADPSESLILRNTTHTGPIRGLDFNPTQPHLFSSGAVNGEIYIWDLKDPTKPYSPGNRSTKLDEITSLAWNHHVQYVLAASSSSGFTVVWDLRGKREVAALTYGGGAGTMGGAPNFATGGMAIGGRRGMSDVAWHPDNATRLVTSSEDDMSPIIMVWDLRNARAPEKILTGHEKGVLSLSWCKQDPDLLLSCGKDNRALCWNPQTSDIIGELPSADNWAFQVQWCPRNPDLFAAGFFDGTIGIHSVQATNDESVTVQQIPQADGSDIFDAPGFSRADRATLSLKQPPRWLRRPISSAFGYGGRLVTVSNLTSAQGKHQSNVVHLRKVVSEESVVGRAKKLQASVDENSLQVFAEDKSNEAEGQAGAAGASWKALLSLFQANSRDELVTILGFSKSEVATRVAEAIANLKAATDTDQKSLFEEDLSDIKLHEPVVSFAEPERDPSSDDDEGDETLDAGGNPIENTPSEVSGSAASDTTSAMRLVDGESTTTAPSLFGDDNIGTPQTDAGADFFSTMGLADMSDAPHIRVPHHNYGIDSSVAATIGSGPSSVASETLKNNNFRIYPNDESETDRLVTKALVLGDFESAVSLCLSANRFADAILLAVKGGEDLLLKTQKAYFERRTLSLPYLRLFQSIVTNDLSDIVQNADLHEWQEIFVVLCTFASQEEFSSLTEQLGRRLEFQSHLTKGSEAPGAMSRALACRKHATLTYLAAGRLERLVNIWIEELAEDEKSIVEDEEDCGGSRYAIHAHALQTFIEKVTVFCSAVKYIDTDIQTSNGEDSSARTYKLSSLYDRYFEYADLLASQGLVKEAVAFLKLTPEDYVGSLGSAFDFKLGRVRLLNAAGLARSPPLAITIDSTPVVPTKKIPSSASNYPYAQYNQPAASTGPEHTPPQNTYETFAPTNNYNPVNQVNAQPVLQSQYQPPAPHVQQSFAPTNQHRPQTFPTSTPQQRSAVLPPPPPPPRQFNGNSASTAAPPQPPLSQRRDNSGWNDAPPVLDKRPPSRTNANKVSAITSPFPNAPTSPATPSSSPYMNQGQSAPLPPPPRPGSVNSRPHPPPPARQSPLQHQPPHQQGYGSPPPGIPPQRLASPLQAPVVRPPPGQYARPPSRGPMPIGSAPPPPGGTHGPPVGPPQPSPGPYGPPPSQQPGGHHPPPMGSRMAPPPPAAVPPPPQGPPRAGLPSGANAPPPPQPRVQKGPPAPKYPPGDRSHIPDDMRLVYDVISDQMNHLRQVSPPQQKRLVDDVERRINPLFDALNCETLSKNVTDQLLVLAKAMEAHDREAAGSIHMDLLTRGSQTDDIGLWMSGVKQLILRL